MAKSATDIVQDVINAAVVDAIVALKDASQGLPNALIRDLASIHANTAFDDLPSAVQKAVAASVRNAFAQLRKDGYVIAEAKSVLPTAPRPAPTGAAGRTDRAPRRDVPKPGGARRPPRGRDKPRP
ncbi:MAG: hypothetical protein JWL96_2102 [Sphingomonas bacterium]|jgi:hypothetical protein|uniref:hypothetical protein n=1 Tax=Sphingomonas bacterium TaxID=1895847 RepID=UPI00260D18B4|nr:hypothetical protein [Sphingomonas bacterium]MDB5710032.1 hypothetical protein [Sphingomonas bacterium]